MRHGDEQVFVCSACGEHVDVNQSMREALVEYGCVICGAAVTDDDFRRDR